MLKIKFSDDRMEPVALAAPGKTIGSGAVNDIVIDEPGVNGFHADLKVEAGQVTISDVNTESGTMVNGERLEAPRNLRAGDTVEIQGVKLEVFEEDPGEGKTLVLSGTALREQTATCWSLEAASGPEKGQIIPIAELTEIGRALECDISILEPSLSRKHAELQVADDGRLTLADLGSANGSYVNGDKISSQALHAGDVIQFGKIGFVIRPPDRD